jgi:hypothetical protein
MGGSTVGGSIVGGNTLGGWEYCGWEYCGQDTKVWKLTPHPRQDPCWGLVVEPRCNVYNVAAFVFQNKLKLLKC